MKKEAHTLTVELVEPLLHVPRGERIILDADLAHIYGVPTKRLNEQVKRNAERFPGDFAFRLTSDEAVKLVRSRSQIATLKRGQNIKYLPYAFTEHGAIMAANVLNSQPGHADERLRRPRLCEDAGGVIGQPATRPEAGRT